MADEGIDAIASGSIIFQIKWSSKLLQDPLAWLVKALEGERKKIEKLVAAKRLRRYILITSVAGTTSGNRTGSAQLIEDELARFTADFGIPFECWWQADVDAEVDAAPDAIKWSYQEMLAGSDAIRYLMHGTSISQEAASMRDTIVQVMATQWKEDARVKFSQLEMGVALDDIFVDVPGLVEQRPTALAGQAFMRENLWTNQAAGTAQAQGAVAQLVETQEPFTFLLGVPGQGKSTLSQRLAQLHRGSILPASQSPDVDSGRFAALSNPRLVLRVDLKLYAVWLSGIDPFADEPGTRRPGTRARSIEIFLAELCAELSGGRLVSVEQLPSMLDRYPTLLIFDGLDEVADPDQRAFAVDQIDSLVRRMALTSNVRTFQIVVTARPNATSLAEPDPSVFEVMRLEPLDEQLQRQFVDKWTAVYGLSRAERGKLRRVFENRVAFDHVAQLADNPMQLTILLYLIHRKGEAVPVTRTPLYTDYMQTLLDREVDNRQIRQDDVARVKEVTSFLGWHFHSNAELDSSAGRMARAGIENSLMLYFRNTGRPDARPEQLFTAVTDRFWALTSKVQGTFEFAVQPVREYFAARYLAEWAGQDRRAPLLKHEVLRELIERPYWLNVARFYAGFANPNEVAGLRYGLQDAMSDGRHPLQERVAIWSLLLDGVFADNESVQTDVLRMVSDPLTIRFLDGATAGDIVFARLGKRHGGTQFASLLLERVAAEPGNPITPATLRVLRRYTPLTEAMFTEWWLPKMQAAIGGALEHAWLEVGAQSATGQLGAFQARRLTLARPRPCSALLAASSAALEAQVDATLRAAVLAGWCSDVATPGTHLAGQLLRAMRPQWFLQLHEEARKGPTIPCEYFWTTDADRPTRTAAWRLLKANDERYVRLQRAVSGGVGQKGTTERWQNPARELADIVGPCWLAAEIAVIGALSSKNVRRSGTFRPNAQPLGLDPDYGTLVLVLKSGPGLMWWQAARDDFPDQLSRMTWLLAVAAVCNEQILLELLPSFSVVLASLSEDDFSTVAIAAGRIAATCVGRRLNFATLNALARHDTRTRLVLVPFCCGRDDLDPLDPLLDVDLVEMAGPDPYTWPVARALTFRMMMNPRPELLEGLRRIGPASRVKMPEIAPATMETHQGAEEVAREILRDAGTFPQAWVTLAERLISWSNSESTLADTALEMEWSPEVPWLRTPRPRSNAVRRSGRSS